MHIDLGLFKIITLHRLIVASPALNEPSTSPSPNEINSSPSPQQMRQV